MSDEEDMAGPPPSARGRRQSVCAEPFNPNSVDDDDCEKIVHPKTDEQRTRLAHALKRIFLFKSLDIEQTSEVMDAMFERKVTSGDQVIEQGDDGDNFYVVDSGVFAIIVGGRNVGEYNNEGSFGELALMYNTPRAATIAATSNGTLWALDRATFRRILLVAAFKKRKMYEEFLDAVPMLASLERYERMTLADALHAEKFEDGACIIKQGDEAQTFFLVEKGEVKIMMTQNDQEEELVHLHKGGYFGELALVTKRPRAASAFAVGDVTLACLDVGAFERLLGPCMEIMKRNFNSYEEQLSKIFGTTLNLSDARA